MGPRCFESYAGDVSARAVLLILTAWQFFTVFKKWKEIESDCAAYAPSSTFSSFTHVLRSLGITKQAMSCADRAKVPFEISGEQVRVSTTLSPLPCNLPPLPPPRLLSLVFLAPMLPIAPPAPIQFSKCVRTVKLLESLEMQEYIEQFMCVVVCFARRMLRLATVSPCLACSDIFCLRIRGVTDSNACDVTQQQLITMGMEISAAKTFMMNVRGHFDLPSPIAAQTVASVLPEFTPIFASADEFTELLYDTAVHGATNKSFHECCDHKGPTIGVFASDEEEHVWGWCGALT
jgi:hypothetical protein